MPTTFYLLSTDRNAIGLFDSFLSGLYLVKGIPLVLQLLILVVFPLAGISAFLSGAESSKKTSARYRMCSIGCSLIGYLFCCLLLFQPWDEVFINLQHSKLLSTQNSFSFNPQTPTEGTVDFLVYFLMGLLAKIGLPLPELAFLQSILGGLFCILIASRIITKLNPNVQLVYPVLFFSLFAPLLLNSSHGFVTTLFTATLLGIVHLIYFNAHPKMGYLLLAILPLIRLEGAWFLILVWLHQLIIYGFRIQLKKHLLTLLLLLVPVGVLSIFRYSYFGSVVPLPIQFKSSLGNLFFTVIGLRNLLADLIAGLGFLSLLTLFFASHRISSNKKSTLLTPLLPITLFIIPYYLSGGDWFPSSWGRYLFPLTLYSAIAAFTAVSLVVTDSKRNLFVFLTFSFALQNLSSFGAFPKSIELLFSPRKSLAPLDIKKKIHRVNYRSHHLSQLGTHLKLLTQPTDLIASSEIATIMYFAERETYDFLGLTNKEIISKPLRPTPNLWRPNPKNNELPYLIFKRLAPELLSKHQPSILYTFDFLTEEILEDTPFDELTTQDLNLAFRRWEKKFQGLLGPLYGGIESITLAGYTPVFVKYRNEFCSLYFVSKASLNLHLENARKQNFRIEKFSYIHPVAPSLKTAF